MQMESYTAEKRILNQQLGRRRANRVDACFSSLGQRRWQNSCRDMHADMFAVLRPRPLPARQSLPLPFLFQPSFFVTGTIDETAIERILFSPSKGRSADRVVQGGGWRYKYLFVGIRRI